MFDISADDISRLNDTDLRELLGRLCEAELAQRGLSPSFVTWGGNQTAKDGGVDVRVELPAGTQIEGFIPRASTGFQVKSQDMPRKAILAEVRPKGVIRPAIRELAAADGAYIIASSQGSVADSALIARRNALREAVDGMEHADQLFTDFYDRTRLASWVRVHPGVLLWAKARVGKALLGWKPYGSWCSGAEDEKAEYLLDDRLRLDLGRDRRGGSRSITDAVDELRDRLRQRGKVVRLVGLSGVGKTRFVQALFDDRVGLRPLAPPLAVYTNLSDDPDPQPIGMATELIQLRRPAVLVIDNCPPDLHNRLSELCCAQGSTISVITVEYDVRDDQPEGTQVVRLDTASPELIEKLVARRYPQVSAVDARTIATFSGGNARIAIALAETVERDEPISGFTNDQLFQRLFRQRHTSDPSMLHAARVCSLVYSFAVEPLEGDGSELGLLASLVGQTPAEMYRHVSEMLRRQLVQQRGGWRAVLPHAIANRLAAHALQDIPVQLIEQAFFRPGSERLLRSFSRRLSFLHDHPPAVAIVEKWLAPGGMLGDVATLNDLGLAMFTNVAPVVPGRALAAIERVGVVDSAAFGALNRSHQTLLRSLAYDPQLFDRSTKVLAMIAIHGDRERERDESAEILTSLFKLYLSGTHATVEQRISVVEGFLASSDQKVHQLGVLALTALIQTSRFSAGRSFEFGARSRDFGYYPKTNEESARWFREVLRFVERLAFADGDLPEHARDLLAQNFQGLWRLTGARDDLERVIHGIVAAGFWCEGWLRCREAMHLIRRRSKEGPEARLIALERLLQPTNLQDRVRAVVFARGRYGVGLEESPNDDDVTDDQAQADFRAEELGAEVVQNPTAFAELLPEMVRRGHRTWWFGTGLCRGSHDRQATWGCLLDAMEHCDPNLRDARVLQGFLRKLNEEDPDHVQRLLNDAMGRPVLWPFLPDLHAAAGLDEQGVVRLVSAAREGKTPASVYQHMAVGATSLSSEILRPLILAVAEQPDGLVAAFDIFENRVFWNRTHKMEHESSLLEIGRDLLGRVQFARGDEAKDYELGDLVRLCMADPAAGPSAADLAQRLAEAIVTGETYSHSHPEVQQALLEVHPVAVLDAFFGAGDTGHIDAVEMFDHGDHRSNPADVVPVDTLIDWCERDPENRYVLAAAFVSFSKIQGAGEPLAWTDQAAGLLKHAPDRRRVVDTFVERFAPMSWSGSRASIMEKNAELLDSLDPIVVSDIQAFIEEKRRGLAQEVDRERVWEVQRERVENERFE